MFDKGIQSILIGEKSAEQVAESVQTVKNREKSKPAALAPRAMAAQ